LVVQHTFALVQTSWQSRLEGWHDLRSKEGFFERVTCPFAIRFALHIESGVISGTLVLTIGLDLCLHGRCLQDIWVRSLGRMCLTLKACLDDVWES
jgi:hypothetical protein